MALTKTELIDRIEVLRDGTIQVREVREIRDDDELVSERFRRYVLVPTDDPLLVPNMRLRKLCQFVWTPAVIDAYIAALPAPPSSPS